MEVINEKIEINESVFVLYHVMNSLYQNFYGSIPKDILEELTNLIVKLQDMISKDFDNYEIADYKVYKEYFLTKENF